MKLAHGDKVVERVEIKRDSSSPPSQTAEKENLDDQPSSSQSSQPEDWDA